MTTVEGGGIEILAAGMGGGIKDTCCCSRKRRKETADVFLFPFSRLLPPPLFLCLLLFPFRGKGSDVNFFSPVLWWVAGAVYFSFCPPFLPPPIEPLDVLKRGKKVQEIKKMRKKS